MGLMNRVNIKENQRKNYQRLREIGKKWKKWILENAKNTDMSENWKEEDKLKV